MNYTLYIIQSTTTHAVLMCAILRAEHVGQHDRDTMIGPLSYPMFAKLFKAFIECELAVVTTATQGNHSATSSCNGNEAISMDTSASASLELQEPDATNYYGHYQKNHDDSTNQEGEGEEELRQEESTSNGDNNNNNKVSFCPFSAVTPAVDKLTCSHHHRQHCILALSELLNEATRASCKNQDRICGTNLC
jgi:hypothetical protein